MGFYGEDGLHATFFFKLIKIGMAVMMTRRRSVYLMLVTVMLRVSVAMRMLVRVRMLVRLRMRPRGC